MPARVPGLYRRRVLAAMTQEQLAERASVQRQTIVRLEKGGVAHPTTVSALARALHCDPAALMGEDNENAPPDP